LRAIRIDRALSSGGEKVYKVSLLNKNQSVTFSFFGYAADLLPRDAMRVIVQKKDWEQRNVEKVDLGADVKTGLFASMLNVFGKRVADWTGFDILLWTVPVFYPFVIMYYYNQMRYNLIYRIREEIRRDLR
jgi:hypothetical protein